MVSQSATCKVSTRCASAFCPTVCPASPSLPHSGAPWRPLVPGATHVDCPCRDYASCPSHTHKHARTLRANCMWNLGSCAGCALKISPNATHLFFICANVWPKHKDTNTYIYIYPCECVCVSSAPYFALPEEIRISQQTRFVSFTCEIIN